jgi:hypothetical protein
VEFFHIEGWHPTSKGRSAELGIDRCPERIARQLLSRESGHPDGDIVILFSIVARSVPRRRPPTLELSIVIVVILLLAPLAAARTSGREVLRPRTPTM